MNNMPFPKFTLNSKWLFSIICLLMFSFNANAQENIFELMERTDLSIQEVESRAKTYFDRVGTGQGSGNKQYQRWLYERKFHLDENGNYIKPEIEDRLYYNAKRSMGAKSRTLMTWSELGPQNWSYTSGWNPGVGRVTSVAVDPTNNNIIYVSSPGGGIWKTSSGGNAWTPLIDFVNSSWMNVFHLYIDPNNTNTIYASLSSGGVLKSTNAGSSWSTTGSGPSGSKQIKVHPTNSNIVFCAANNGIWRSTNAGTNWTQVETATKEDIEFNPTNPDIMYAAGSSGASCVWRSVDNGLTWTAIGSGAGITNTGRTLLAVSAADPNVVYAVQASGSVFGRMYRSSDAGQTYTTTVTGGSTTNYFGYNSDGTGTTGQATYDMAICVNPTNVNEVHIAGIICWKSTNGGTSFTATTIWSYPNGTGYNHADVHALEWVGTTIFSGSDGGIYKSTNNAGDWTDLSATLGIRQFYRLACAKTDANVITTGAQDNGSSFRRTTGAWVDWLGADGMDNIISPTNAAIAIGTSQYGSIYKTTNSGASYSGLSKPPGGNWVTPIFMHPTNHDTVYGGWTGVYKSTNGGTSWTNISSGVITSNVEVLAVSAANTQFIYASIGSTLYRTSNGGTSWTSVTAPSTITSIHPSKNDPNKIWISCNSSSNRVFVSTDAGSTYVNLSTGLPALSARSVVVDEDASNTIYVGMNIGVYYRDDINNIWTEHGTGLPLVAINEVEIQKSGGKLRVATYGRGVWESEMQNLVQVCNAPTGLNTTDITTNSATLNWSAVGGANNYDVDYKLTSSGVWTNVVTGTTTLSASLSGLTSSTAYDWRVRANCNSGASTYSTATFTTSSECGTPTNLTVTNTSSSSASLSWSVVSGATSYAVDYKLVSSGTWIATAGSATNSITISGLTAGGYDWRVRTICGAGSSTDASAKFNIYCASNGASTSAGYIDLVQLGSINRVSTSDGGYYNGFAMSTNLVPGSSYTITLSPGYSGGRKNVYFRAYIDYNLDGDFADAGEQAGQKTYKNLNNTNISFTVPSSASLGLSKLRVVMSTTGYQASCGTYSSGETEDYSVNLSATATFNNQDESISSLNETKIYPNPATDILHVNFYVDSDEPAEFKIIDQMGRAVYGNKIAATLGSNTAQLDISTLQHGEYFLLYTRKQKFESHNILIMR